MREPYQGAGRPGTNQEAEIEMREPYQGAGRPGTNLEADMM